MAVNGLPFFAAVVTAALATISAGPTCHYCSDMLRPDQCNHTRVCRDNYKCFVEQTIDGTKIKYNVGCDSARECEALSRGRRDTLYRQKRASICYRCCDGDNCNSVDCKAICRHNPCMNNATCTETSAGGQVCKCTEGFEGANCDKAVKPKPCASGPCKNNGTCVNGEDTFICTCRDGYTGNVCETEPTIPPPTRGAALTGFTCFQCNGVDDPSHCSYMTSCGPDEQCFIDGVRSNGMISFNMGCRKNETCAFYEANVPHIVGRRAAHDVTICWRCCSSDMCNSDTCQNTTGPVTEGPSEETPTPISTGPATEGPSEETPTPSPTGPAAFCDSAPCQNGGTCSEATDSYVCACAPGYTDNECQTDIDECGSSPCQNSATCVDQVNAYQCTCPPEFTGTDCETHLSDQGDRRYCPGREGVTTSGVYHLDLKDGGPAFDVYCDMDTDGGGWVVFQRRKDGSVNFDRTWADYQRGFGDLQGEFWLGNDFIHPLTAAGLNHLRVDLKAFDGSTAFAKYSTFSVGDSTSNYRLTVSGYDPKSTAGDSFGKDDGQAFTTKDRDNDNWATSLGWNCAFYNGGAWWYDQCSWATLNGVYDKAGTAGVHNVVWFDWKKSFESLKSTEMKVRGDPVL